MTARLSPQRETELKPVGYFCDHSDEKPGERTHRGWEWVEGDGYVFMHQPDTISSHSSVDQRYLKAENRETRCPRAVPVYTGPAVAAELAAVRAELAEARVGQENARSEMARRPAEAHVLRQAAHALEYSHPDAAAELLVMANRAEQDASDRRWRNAGQGGAR